MLTRVLRKHVFLQKLFLRFTFLSLPSNLEEIYRRHDPTKSIYLNSLKVSGPDYLDFYANVHVALVSHLSIILFNLISNNVLDKNSSGVYAGGGGGGDRGFTGEPLGTETFLIVISRNPEIFHIGGKFRF